MKAIPKHPLTAFAVAVIIAAASPASSARESSDFGSESGWEATSETPRTAGEKLQSLKDRHDQAYSGLSATLNRLPKEPDFLGTKALFTEIDESTREMKNIRAGCTSLMASVSADFKSISASPSFTYGQKQELAESAEALSMEYAELSGKLDLAIKRLGAAYTIFPGWNRIHKSYRSLQGHEKAAQQVKILVDAYLESFVPKPEPAADEGESQNA